MKKKLLAVFLAIGATASGAMYWIERGDWQLALILFVVGNVGVAGSIVFYESLLPHLVPEDQLDRVSSAGYAIGYLGGGVLLAINLLMIMQPGLFGIADAGVATRLSFVSVAVWWAAFSIPLFRHVPEPVRQLEADERPGANLVLTGWHRLVETFQELRR
jgi:UMF1 family MFS transporter